MSAVLAQLQHAAAQERERLAIKQAEFRHAFALKHQLWLSMRAFVTDLLRAVPLLEGHALRAKGNFGTYELNWDDPASRLEFTLTWKEYRYIEAEVAHGDSGPLWHVTTHHRGCYMNQYNKAEVVTTSERLQQHIITKLSRDFPDAFK